MQNFKCELTGELTNARHCWIRAELQRNLVRYGFFDKRPTVGSSICIDADIPCDDESELREMEKEHVAWLKLIQQTAADLLPFGKVPPVGGPDLDTDDEVGNDDSDDSESRDEEEEEEEEVDHDDQLQLDGQHDSSELAVV